MTYGRFVRLDAAACKTQRAGCTIAALAARGWIWSFEGVQGEAVDARKIMELLTEEGLLDAPVTLPPDADLFAAGLDSMAVMQLIVIVEEKFGVVIEPAEAGRENLGTPGALAALISRKLS